MDITSVKLIRKPSMDKESLRDNLALDRTRLANERTVLAYTRTSLYLLIGGIALLQLRDFENLKWLGYLSLFLCVSLLAIGVTRFLLLRRVLNKRAVMLNQSAAPSKLGSDK